MSLELVIALIALAVSLTTLVVVLSRPVSTFHCRIDVPDSLPGALMMIESSLHRVAMSVDRHASRLPDLKADRAQQHAMRLSRALQDVDEP